MSNTQTVARHITVNGYDTEGNILPTINLAPGDEVPQEIAHLASEHWFQPLPEDQVFMVDEETGTEIKESPGGINDHTSPTERTKYEDGVVTAYTAPYETMKKEQLATLAEERGLPTSGTRQEIIERLQQNDAEVS